MTLINEVVLLESATVRAQYVGYVDAIDKVGALAVLPDGVQATTEMVAGYFEVDPNTLSQAVKRNRKELESNGLHVLKGQDLADFKDRYRTYLSSEVLRSARLTVFTRSTVLTIGQLLTGSKVAERLRQYLVALDTTATAEHKQSAVQLVRIQERMDYRHVKHALKLGGAISDDYRIVQNTLYTRLFGMTATAIRATQPQLTGERVKDGTRFTKASQGIAKNFLTESQLELLNNTVLGMFIQINQHYPNGATVQQMLVAVNRAADLTMPKAVAA